MLKDDIITEKDSIIAEKDKQLAAKDEIIYRLALDNPVVLSSKKYIGLCSTYF
jgi:hypothetical protein